MGLFDFLFGNKKRKEAELAYKKLEQKPRKDTLYDKMGGPHRPIRFVDDYVPPYQPLTDADKRIISAQQKSLDELKRKQRIEDEEYETRRRKKQDEPSSFYWPPVVDVNPSSSTFDNTPDNLTFGGFDGGSGGGSGASGDWSSNSDSSSSYDSSSSSDSSSYDSGGGDSGGSSD